MELKLRQRETRGVEQSSQTSGFLGELRRVGEVLKLASAAEAKVRAGGCGTVRIGAVFAVADWVVDGEAHL